MGYIIELRHEIPVTYARYGNMDMITMVWKKQDATIFETRETADRVRDRIYFDYQPEVVSTEPESIFTKDW